MSVMIRYQGSAESPGFGDSAGFVSKDKAADFERHKVCAARLGGFREFPKRAAESRKVMSLCPSPSFAFPTAIFEPQHTVRRARKVRQRQIFLHGHRRKLLKTKEH